MLESGRWTAQRAAGEMLARPEKRKGRRAKWIYVRIEKNGKKTFGVRIPLFAANLAARALTPLIKKAAAHAAKRGKVEGHVALPADVDFSAALEVLRKCAPTKLVEVQDNGDYVLVQTL